MAYTASALSFMLEQLGKPVILTGGAMPSLLTCGGQHCYLAAVQDHSCLLKSLSQMLTSIHGK